MIQIKILLRRSVVGLFGKLVQRVGDMMAQEIAVGLEESADVGRKRLDRLAGDESFGIRSPGANQLWKREK